MRSWRTDPPGFAQALRVWRRNRCVGRGTSAVYRYWICRFVDYCRICKLDERRELTEQGAERFARWWRSTGSPRHGHLRSSILSSRSALRAWAFARVILGDALPTWRTVCEPPVPRAPRAFAIYVSEVRGNPPGTIQAKLAHMACLLRAIGDRESSARYRVCASNSTVSKGSVTGIGSSPARIASHKQIKG
jgi:hypothetical protein